MTTSNTSKYGQNSWRAFLMTSRTECASSTYLGDALLGEDIVREMAWKDSLISTMVVTPVSLSHFIPLLHTSQDDSKAGNGGMWFVLQVVQTQEATYEEGHDESVE